MMRRREVIAVLCGAAAWPVAARAQQTERVRRIGVLMSTAADDPEGRARITAFRDGLRQSGWTDGRNVQIDARWPQGGAEAQKYAAELVALAPDIILATGVYAGSLLQQETRTIPIVFVLVADPVAPASSRASRGRAAMPPAFCIPNTASAGNGWSC
jgi:putative ABC transport system substrate-binding protein